MRRSAADSTAVILAAARERFAADGYEKSTIRVIAADAGIDPAMVIRYFGSKDRLFATAAEFDLRLPDLTRVPREQLGEVVVRHFLDRWSADEGLRVLLRAGVTNEAAAERMRVVFGAQLAPAIAARGVDRAATRAVLAASQVLGMALCRYILRFPPAVDLTDAELVAWLAPTVNRYLTD